MTGVAHYAPVSEQDRDHATSRRALERWACVGILILYSGGIFDLLSLGPAGIDLGTTDGNPLLRASKGVAYCLTLWLVSRSPRRSFGFAGTLLAAILGLAAASATWSGSTGETALRAFQLMLTTAFAWSFASRYSLDEQLECIRYALLVLLISSLILGLLFPEYGLMHGEFEGAWRGAFTHKNGLGRVSLLGLVVFGSIISRRERRKSVDIFGFIASALLLILSTSRSPLVELLVIISLVPLFRSFRKQGSLFLVYVLGASSAALIVAVWGYSHLDKILELLGRDATMSGRTALWFAVLSFISQRPWLGYGFGAFWQGMNGNSAFISLALNWQVPHAHDGYLDATLDIGLVGLSLVVAFIVIGARNAVRSIRRDDRGGSIWPLLCLTFLVLSNLTESALLRHSNVFWVLLVSTVLSVSVQPNPQVSHPE